MRAAARARRRVLRRRPPRKVTSSPSIGAPVLSGVPLAFLRAPLLASGGFQVRDDVLDLQTRWRLRREAVDRLPAATASAVDEPCTEEVRGGSPARRFLSAPGGPWQDALYRALRAFLGALSGIEVEPTGARGTFTYYARAGDHLDVHRDVHGCDIAVISLLHEEPTRHLGGGALRLYPSRLLEPLSALRLDPRNGAVSLRLVPGESLILAGGLVPHCVEPVDARQCRVVSVLCYRFAAV